MRDRVARVLHRVAEWLSPPGPLVIVTIIEEDGVVIERTERELVRRGAMARLEAYERTEALARRDS